jgi:hypothetical protein
MIISDSRQSGFDLTDSGYDAIPEGSTSPSTQKSHSMPVTTTVQPGIRVNSPPPSQSVVLLSAGVRSGRAKYWARWPTKAQEHRRSPHASCGVSHHDPP